MPEPRWLTIARAEIGQREVAGPQTNPRIAVYHATTSLHATSDEVPWCSSFVNWCVAQAGLVGTGSAAAKSWLTWGAGSVPQVGAICVIRKRGIGHDQATGSASGYHVGFWLSQDVTSIRLLGGNQGDSVSECDFRLRSYDVLALRWPERYTES